MIIHTDVDGVLADFVGGLCIELGARGFRRAPDDVRHWELAKSFSDEELRAAHEIMASPGFCHALEWYEGARDFLRALRGEGEVHAVTAPFRSSSSWMHERYGWLSSEVQGDRVHFVSGKYKHLLRGDVLVEDHPGTARAWCEVNESGVAILIDRPWNRPGADEFWPHSRMFRAQSYGEALHLLRECS